MKTKLTSALFLILALALMALVQNMPEREKVRQIKAEPRHANNHN